MAEPMRTAVFIHTNEKQLLGARVSAFSLKMRSDQPDTFDVRLIKVESYAELMQRHGQSYLRRGGKLNWDVNDLQSFTLTRFLAPQLMEFSGRALVIDPDVFAIGEIAELLRRDMQGKAVVCRRIDPGDGRQPYFATSVMLLDCARLSHWQWSSSIEKLFRHELDYHQWMNLLNEDPGTIGNLEEEWNHFDTLNDRTRLLHNTNRVTQPWKTGLPVDFVKHPVARRTWRTAFLRRSSTNVTPSVYEPHPDPRQESHFFELLAAAVEAGEIELEFVAEQVALGYVRCDAMQMLSAARERLALSQKIPRRAGES